MPLMRLPVAVLLFTALTWSGLGARRAAGQSQRPARCSSPKTGVCAGVDLQGGRFSYLPPDIVANDFRLAPPHVNAVTAKKAASGGGTLVRVSLAKDERLGPTLVLGRGQETMVLRDEGTEGDERAGDGLYSVVVPLAFEKVTAGQTALASALRQKGIASLPVFDGRQVARQAPLSDFGIRDGTVVILPPGSIGMLASPLRTLMVTDPGVIKDATRTFDGCASTGNPNGVWTFKHLIEEMANSSATGLDPEDMAREWFHTLIEGVFGPGTANSKWPASQDLAHAPFRLVAIVNRIDLASSPVGYGGAVAGGGGAEGRFVFELCSGGKDMVIFEYGIPRSGCGPLRDWAQRWLALNAWVPGTDAYDSALEVLTEEFVRHGAGGTKPNGSALNQVRTNGFLQGGTLEDWRLQEWRIQHDGEGPTGFTVAQTPRGDFNGTAPLGAWINLERLSILAGTHVVGTYFSPIDSSRPFLGTEAISEIFTGSPPQISFWRAPGITDNQARHLFSLATCDGCHVRETDTHFRHLGSGIPPSGFLTGINVVDPVMSFTVRHFDDLSRRAHSLATLAGGSCPADPFHGLVGVGVQFAPKIGEVNLPLPPITYIPLLSPH